MAALIALPAGGPASSPTDWTLQEASEQIRRGTISPVELTRACLERIDRLNRQLNCFITVTADQALAQARAMESELRAGKWRGPLHGIPIGLKDLIDTAGVKTTCGSALFAERVPAEDADVVQRLKRAGAVLLGKQNMHEFAYGGTSAVSHYGPVRNPWNPGMISGGSSGGSAAAVAAGLCFAALGSDTNGSIRQPAAYCGITGLKATYGRVSTRGVVPLSWSQDHIGPLCRTAMDAALVLEAIVGYDANEITSVDWPVEKYSRAPRVRVKTLKIGAPRAYFFEQLDPDIQSAMNEVERVLKRIAGGIRETKIPPFRTLPITGAEAYTYHKPYFTKTPELYQEQTRKRLEEAAKVTAAEYAEARRELDWLRRSVAGVFSEVDLLIVPTTPMMPVKIEDAVAFDSQTGGPPLRNTRPFSYFGLPTISVPCGVSGAGMPIGLQIVGPRFGESRVLALAHAFQQATTWHTRRPGV
jgi:aspartyl-tRNA(Asn)/glutamyl-tRNA(Gln) amidotransferase subunit A